MRLEVVDLRRKLVYIRGDGDVFLAQLQCPVRKRLVRLGLYEPDGFSCVAGNKGGHILFRLLVPLIAKMRLVSEDLQTPS